MWSRAALCSALVALAIGLTGCGGSAGATAAGGDAPGTTVVGLDSMRFNPDTITVKAGTAVKLTFRNGGILPHDLITEGADQNVRLTNITGGRAGSGTFLASKPGTYAVVCVQPGHKEAGMVGKIVVE